MCDVQTEGPWRLAAGIHAAAVGEDVVFLSVPFDRYQCLPSAAQLLELTPGDAAVEVRRPELAAALFSAGLISRGPSLPRRAVPPLPSASLSEGPFGPLRGHDLASMARCSLDLATAYRGRPLSELLATVGLSRARRGPPSAHLADVVSAFHSWLPWAPLPGKCLLRSFMLLRLLHRRGLDADWVFGVRTSPFAAHCWLQAGGTALEEHPDRLTGFTPILAA